MFKPTAVLLAVGAAGLGGALLFLGKDNFSPAILGVSITLPPALLSMLAVGVVAKRWPQLGVTFILSGCALRMGWATVAVAALAKKADLWETTPQALANGTVSFYLLLLVAETILLRGLLDGGTAKPPEGQPGPR
jgi:hypothetical protein